MAAAGEAHGPVVEAAKHLVVRFHICHPWPRSRADVGIMRTTSNSPNFMELLVSTFEIEFGTTGIQMSNSLHQGFYSPG